MLTLNVNRRYLPEESAKAVEDEFRVTIEQAVAKSALLDCSIDVVGHLPPVIDPDGPLTQRWTLAQSVGYGVPLREFVRFGSSTSSDFGWVQKAGIQHMMLGGLSRPSRHIHGPDEYTTRTDLIGLARSVFLMLSADFTDDFQGAAGAQRDNSLTRATLTTE
jgi:succinyl-diaminopimelate desuccinylase